MTPDAGTAGFRTRPIVTAILIGVAILALTLVAIDWARTIRCRDYGEAVLVFYQQQSDMELDRGIELSPVTVRAALLENVGYPPPGCSIP
jgi:hypothetical protein